MSEAEEWVQYAREDLEAARVAKEQGLAPRVVAFHAQQAAEKAVKAALIGFGIAPPPVHDLETLVERLPVESSMRSTDADFGALMQAAMKGRYPDTAVEITEDRARLCLRDAGALVDSAQSDIARAGAG